MVALPLLRYWLSPHVYDRPSIRVEWATGTSQGELTLDGAGDYALRWLYDVPPDDVAEAALDTLLARLRGGGTLACCQGVETDQQMDRAIARYYERRNGGMAVASC